MATGANQYNKHYGNQQWSTTTTTGSGSITYTYPNHKDEMKNAKKLKPLPKIDYVEFGKQYSVAATTVAASTDTVKDAYALALDEFFKEKQRSFPTWDGLPEIKTGPSTDPLNRRYEFGWYARVPKIHVIDPEQVEEDELWNS